LFPHKGQIITNDQLSFSCYDPSLGASTILMINNPQSGIVNLGVGFFPSLMGTFDYPSLANDVKFISVFLNYPMTTIFQVTSFRTSYFNDPWILPSPSTLMEGARHPGMDMPLSIVEVAYSIVQQASANPNMTPPHELDLVLKPVWARDSLATYDPLELVFPSNEVILEAMTGPEKPWDDLHHISYFLPELKRI